MPLNPESHAGSPVSVDAAWLAVSDDVLASVNHALSNRLAALISLVRVMEFGGSESESLMPVLAQEVDRLEQATALLRLLPRGHDDQPEPVRFVDAVPDLLALLHLQRDVRELPIDVAPATDAPPAWIDPTTLNHALLMLFSALTRLALASGAPRIDVQPGGDDEWATLVAIVPPPEAEGGGDDPGGNAGERAAREMDAADALLRHAGGAVLRRESESGAVRVEVRVPTLLAARRREAAHQA